jgi:hypothetical protein
LFGENNVTIETKARQEERPMGDGESGRVKELGERLAEVERTLRNTIAEIERTTLSHINHDPKRIAEAERSLKSIDVERLTDLQHVLRKLRLS